MSDDSTLGPEPTPPTDPAGPSRTARQGLVAGLVVGLLVGGGGVGLAWVLTSDDPESGAETDASAACMAIEDVEVPTPEEDPSLTLMRRWAGASELAAAAAEADSSFQKLADEFTLVRESISMFELDRAGDAARNVQDICAGL